MQATSRGATRHLRTLATLGVVAAIALSAIDVASIMLTRFQVSDDVRSAGRAAVGAVRGRPVDSQAALLAYAAATNAAGNEEEVLTEGFLVQPDGGVTLTLRRSAPTLLFDQFGPLEDLTVVDDTWTQPRVG